MTTFEEMFRSATGGMSPYPHSMIGVFHRPRFGRPSMENSVKAGLSMPQ